MECGREQPAKDLGEEAQKDLTKTQQGPGEHPAEEAERSLVSSPVRNEWRRGLCSATCKVAASPRPLSRTAVPLRQHRELTAAGTLEGST